MSKNDYEANYDDMSNYHYYGTGKTLDAAMLALVNTMMTTGKISKSSLEDHIEGVSAKYGKTWVDDGVVADAYMLAVRSAR